MNLRRLVRKSVQVNSSRRCMTTMNIGKLSHQEALDALKRITEKHPELQKELFQKNDEKNRPPTSNKKEKKSKTFLRAPSTGEHTKARVIEYSRNLSQIPSPTERGFDMAKYRQRHVALSIAYLGKNYHGFASQAAGGGDVDGRVILKQAAEEKARNSLPRGEQPVDESDSMHTSASESEESSSESGTKRKRSDNSSSTRKGAFKPPKKAVEEATHYATVEALLFGALNKACLISSRIGSGYNRCGRTDRGVSSSGQIISIRLRSKALRKDTPVVENGQDDVTPWNIHTPQGRCSFAGDDIGNIHHFNAPSSDTTSGKDSTSQGANNTNNTVSRHLTRAWCRGDGLPNTGEPFPDPSEELDYANILNAILPPDIRVLGWSDVPDDFSARFSASIRSYRYFFPKRDLDIQAMRRAGRLLTGVHDFRNIAKIDLENTQNFIRELLSIRVVKCSANYTPTKEESMRERKRPDDGTDQSANSSPFPLPCPTSIYTSMECTSFDPRQLEKEADFKASGVSIPRKGSSALFHEPYQSKIAELDARHDVNISPDSEFSIPPPAGLESLTDAGDMYYIEVVGRAFLWHQVRCIAALLFHVGRNLETPESVRDLLDIEKYPARPQYVMADEHALLLHHCSFGDEEDITEEEWKARAELYRREGEETDETDAELARRPVRYVRTYPMLYSNMHVSVSSLRKLTQDLENQWSRQMIEASMIRATLDKLYALPVDHNQIREAVRLPPLEDVSVSSETSKLTWGEAVTLYGGKRALHNGHQPLLHLSDSEYTIFYKTNGKKKKKNRNPPAQEPQRTKDKHEFTEEEQERFGPYDTTTCVQLPYKPVGYVPLSGRVQCARVEDRWNSLSVEKREVIKSKHPTNAPKLDQSAKQTKPHGVATKSEE